LLPFLYKEFGFKWSVIGPFSSWDKCENYLKVETNNFHDGLKKQILYKESSRWDKKNMKVEINNYLRTLKLFQN